MENNRLDDNELEVLQKNPVNQIPSFHVGYKIVAVYKLYAHKKIAYHSQFYISEYGVSYLPCLVGHPGVGGFNLYTRDDYPPLKRFLETHARDVKYWR